MIDLLVFGATGAAVVFFLVWLASPNLRRRIEQPKYQFLRDVGIADGVADGPADGASGEAISRGRQRRYDQSDGPQR